VASPSMATARGRAAATRGDVRRWLTSGWVGEPHARRRGGRRRRQPAARLRTWQASQAPPGARGHGLRARAIDLVDEPEAASAGMRLCPRVDARRDVERLATRAEPEVPRGGRAQRKLLRREDERRGGTRTVGADGLCRRRAASAARRRAPGAAVGAWPSPRPPAAPRRPAAAPRARVTVHSDASSRTTARPRYCPRRTCRRLSRRAGAGDALAQRYRRRLRAQDEAWSAAAAGPSATGSREASFELDGARGAPPSASDRSAPVLRPRTAVEVAARRTPPRAPPARPALPRGPARASRARRGRPRSAARTRAVELEPVAELQLVAAAQVR